MSALAAVLTLSLTLGTAASVFSVVDAVLLTPPPFADPGQLFTVGELPSDAPVAAVPRAVAYGTFEAWRDRARSMAAFEAFDGTNVTLTRVGAAERLQVTDVTPGFLRLLGVSPAIGRTFSGDDIGRSVVIVSHAFWQRKLAADPAIVGRDLVLGGRSHTVVGVLPKGFVFALGAADVWRPLDIPGAQAARDGMRVRVIARLNRAATSTGLAAALAGVSRASRPPRIVATNVATAIAGDRAATLRLLAGAAAIATFMAFANLACLLIVRSIDRRRELAVRTALGAGPSETTRQLLLESGAIVALGTIGGVALAWSMTPVIADLILERVGEFATREVPLSWRVTGGLAMLACAGGGICGWLTALTATRWNVGDVVRRGGTASTRELGIRRAFVVGEVALAFMLLVSMSVVGRTLLNLLEVDLGFDPRGVVALQLSLPGAGYPSDEEVAAFYSTLESALADRLGPRASAIVDELPLTGSGGRGLVGVPSDSIGREAILRTASANYFAVMGIPVLAGHSFARTDVAGGATRAQAIISHALADRMFASESPLGRQIWIAEAAQVADVIGVVADVKHRSVDETSTPTVYVSSARAPSKSSVIVVRSERLTADVIAMVRQEVARLDPNLPVYRVRPMTDVVAASPGLPARRMVASTFAGLALLALVLSAIGLFGVAAHDVACRRPELTLRIALGAGPARILAATIGRGVVTVAVGLVIGSALSMGTVNALTGLSETSGRTDVFGVAMAATLLLAIGVAAISPAALRASRIEPRMVLHME